MRSQSERARRKFVTQIWRDLARDKITIATTVNQQHPIIKLTLVQYLVSVDKRNQAEKRSRSYLGVLNMEVTRATIGSDSWKKASVKNLQLGKAVMDRNEHACALGKHLDPLPSLRDNCIQHSNARIHSYVRATRAVVVKLRESLLDTNKEIKSLTRCKENLERALEHLRKDLLLNQRSCEVRATRPPRERVGFKSILSSFTYKDLYLESCFFSNNTLRPSGVL